MKWVLLSVAFLYMSQAQGKQAYQLLFFSTFAKPKFTCQYHVKNLTLGTTFEQTLVEEVETVRENFFADEYSGTPPKAFSTLLALENFVRNMGCTPRPITWAHSKACMGALPIGFTPGTSDIKGGEYGFYFGVWPQDWGTIHTNKTLATFNCSAP